MSPEITHAKAALCHIYCYLDATDFNVDTYQLVAKELELVFHRHYSIGISHKSIFRQGFFSKQSDYLALLSFELISFVSLHLAYTVLHGSGFNFKAVDHDVPVIFICLSHDNSSDLMRVFRSFGERGSL